jgi:Zn-dependent protease
MLLDDSIITFIARFIAAGVCMTVHEWAHNWVAWKMGDPDPKYYGKLTLNPLVHIHWFGFLFFVITGWGFGLPLGTAAVSAQRMPLQNRRWRWLATVAAGPFSNLILAALFTALFRLLPLSVLQVGILGQVLQTIILFNCILFLFNLLPLGPLDGWSIAHMLMVRDLQRLWEQYRPITAYIFYGAIIWGFIVSQLGLNPSWDILGAIMRPPLFFLYFTLMGL